MRKTVCARDWMWNDYDCDFVILEIGIQLHNSQNAIVGDSR